MNKAIFLDRDGTLTDESCYPDFFAKNCKLMEKNIGEILKKLKEKGYLLIIITNQAGIDKGYYTKKDFWNFMEELQKQLDFKFDGIFFCPYHPDFSGNYPCRKPNNGMILEAQKKFDIDLKKSYMIGDSKKDIEAGKKSNCKTVLYNSKNLDIKNFEEKPDFVIKNFEELLKIIN